MYDIAILCSFNGNDISSTIYDIVHLYILFMDNKLASNIYLVSDNISLIHNIFIKENNRLYEKRVINTKSISSPQNIIEFKDINSIGSLLSNDKNIFISISGHGYTNNIAYDNNESDMKDEYIIPCNGYQKIIKDNELFNMIRNIKSNIFILVDTCHSGTMFDLPIILNLDGSFFIENNNTTKGNVICISSVPDSLPCMDSFSMYGFGGCLISKYIDYICDLNSTNSVMNDINIKSLLKYMLMEKCVVSLSHISLVPKCISYNGYVSFTYKK